MTATDTAGGGLRARKKRETRRALHLAAVDLVTERGLGGVTTDEIAAAAGVSPRTFFNYFPTKDAAVVGLGPDLPEVFTDELLGRPADEPVMDSLRAALLVALAPLARDDDLRRRRRELIRRHPELVTTTVGVTMRVEEALARAVATRTGTDVEADLYPRLAAACAVGASRAALLHTRRRGGLEASLAEAFDLLAAGLPVRAHPPQDAAASRPGR